MHYKVFENITKEDKQGNSDDVGAKQRVVYSTTYTAIPQGWEAKHTSLL